MRNNISVCGLECDKCDLYLIDENKKAAKRILTWFQEEKWRSVSMTVKEFMNEGKLCLGCRSDREGTHWSGNCRLLECCVDDKGLNSCHECLEFVCEKLEEWGNQPNEKYAEGIERLKNLKKQDT